RLLSSFHLLGHPWGASSITTRANNQFPWPDFHRLDKQSYRLRTKSTKEENIFLRSTVTKLFGLRVLRDLRGEPNHVAVPGSPQESLRTPNESKNRGNALHRLRSLPRGLSRRRGASKDAGHSSHVRSSGASMHWLRRLPSLLPGARRAGGVRTSYYLG